MQLPFLTTATPDAKKKTYYPSKTFDDALANFVKLADDSGWTFSGVDSKTLSEDADAQRSERKEHDALEVKYLKKHEEFGLAQEQRHQRFSSALDAARGAFKNDKAISKQLETFKRTVTRTKKPTPA